MPQAPAGNLVPCTLSCIYRFAINDIIKKVRHIKNMCLFLLVRKEMHMFFIFQLSRSDSVAEGQGNSVPLWGLGIGAMRPLCGIQHGGNRKSQETLAFLCEFPGSKPQSSPSPCYAFAINASPNAPGPTCVPMVEPMATALSASQRMPACDACRRNVRQFSLSQV